MWRSTLKWFTLFNMTFQIFSFVFNVVLPVFIVNERQFEHVHYSFFILNYTVAFIVAPFVIIPRIVVECDEAIIDYRPKENEEHELTEKLRLLRHKANEHI